MMIDPCPSESEYNDKEGLVDLNKLRDEIRNAWKVYQELQDKYRKETGKEYQWFK